MLQKEDFDVVQQNFQESSTFLVLCKPKFTHDQIASALGLFLVLQKNNKNVTIACQHPIPESYNHLAGIDQIQNAIGNRSLEVTFDYNEHAVEKVSYSINEESDTFHLVIQPKKGHQPLDPETIRFTKTGAHADVIFLIGINEYKDIGKFYKQEEQLFQDALTVSLHTHKTSFAQVNLDGSGHSSFSEIVYLLLQSLQVNIEDDEATNLLAGIESATGTFSSLGITAQTFEIAADLMRKGARRSTAHRKLQVSKPQKEKSIQNTKQEKKKPKIHQIKRVEKPSNFSSKTD